MDFDPAITAYVPTTGVRRIHETSVVVATEQSLAGFGQLVDDPETFPIEIVRWPAQGWRPIDANSGDQAGVTAGVSCWIVVCITTSLRRKVKGSHPHGSLLPVPRN